MTAIVVEDGTGLSTSNAYVSVDDCSTYCTARGLTFGTSPTTTGEAAIIRASAAIDALYRSRFPGYKRNGRDQAMEWPRSAAYDNAGELVPDDEVPIEIVQATCEAAVRELADPGAMMPDLERGGGVRRLKAGSVEIEYGANAANQTTFTAIGNLLSGLLAGGDGGGLFATAGRG
jgi:hypothetical protein